MCRCLQNPAHLFYERIIINTGIDKFVVIMMVIMIFLIDNVNSCDLIKLKLPNTVRQFLNDLVSLYFYLFLHYYIMPIESSN